MSAKPTKKKGNKIELKLRAMIAQIEAIIREAQALEKASKALLATIHPKYQVSARNLLHYQVLRRNDISELQKKLGDMGLSRLAKAQSHVMASLKSNRAILKSILTHSHVKNAVGELSFKKGNRLLTENAKNLLGDRTKGRRTQIMVTMPSEAASDYQMVYDMVEAGMNCARVNCAHDDPHVWKKIIDHVRKAAKAFGKDCKVAMDLAGPKIRTGEVQPGPKVLKIRPSKDVWGKVIQPLPVWLGPSPHPTFLHIPITTEHCAQLTKQKALYFKDTRGKKRKLTFIEHQAEGIVAECPQTTFLGTGLLMYLHKDYTGAAISVGELPPQEVPLVLKVGDQLRLDKFPIVGQAAHYSEDGTLTEVAHISCRAPEIFTAVEPDQRILFDDGKIEGRIISVKSDHLMIEIVHAAEGGAKLRAEKGINLPDSHLAISGLTDKDKKDLAFVVLHADVVNFSFVNREEDVVELFDCLRELKAKEDLGVILKIETQSGFNHLPEILFKAMKVYPVGVMIARGDLAIESGWNNIGRVQEEILSLCQAAHVTDIWATQVLESLAKSGLPSRAEITDAVMAQRADCVMLNKGPYILQAIRLLDTILKDMEPYWEKNAPLLPALSRASAAGTSTSGTSGLQQRK